MYRILKITSHTTVDFAAEELKKYLRMMMPRCGEIPVAYTPDAQDGFRLGLMADFGLDTSDAEDVLLDDIIYLDTDETAYLLQAASINFSILSIKKDSVLFP